MSWLFSQALVEDSLPPSCLSSERYALLNWIGIADAFLSSDKMTESYDPVSRFGMTFVPLTADRGVALLTSSLEDFLASLSVKRREAELLQKTSGQKCDGSLTNANRVMCLQKTSAKPQLMPPQTIANRWVTKPKQFPCQRKTWVQTMLGKGVGYLHTPTTKANYAAESMQKWPSAKNFVKAFGRPSPANQEWMMGWPTGWTDTKPLEMDRFQAWQRQHWQSLREVDSRLEGEGS